MCSGACLPIRNPLWQQAPNPKGVDAVIPGASMAPWTSFRTRKPALSRQAREIGSRTAVSTHYTSDEVVIAVRELSGIEKVCVTP